MLDIDFSTILIITANVIVSYKGFHDTYFFRKYEFHIASIKAGDQVRLFTSGFLHVDGMHLFFNMFTLVMFAPLVLQEFGSTFDYLSIYFGSLLMGSLLTVFIHKNDYNYRAVGASGAVTGIIFSSILLFPNLELLLFYIIPIPAYLFGIGYLLYSIYGIKAKNDLIGHTAHFGGAIGGYVITLIKKPSLITENMVMVILLFIPIVILFYMIKKGKF